MRSALLDILESVALGALFVMIFTAFAGAVIGVIYALVWVSYWLAVVPAAFFLLWLLGEGLKD